MNTIYAIKPKGTSAEVSFEKVWTQGPKTGIAGGHTNLVPVDVGGVKALFAYSRSTQTTTAYTLSGAAPWVEQAKAQPDLLGGPWDSLSAFVLGNEPYLVAYRREDGTFAFYRVMPDLTVSKPYSIALTRGTPTAGFSTVAPFSSLGQQYVLGYNFDDGTVAAFRVDVTTTSSGGIPPLRATNVWYHRWAKGWTRFAFFQLGGANFFFKINTAKLNVNIDHLQDDPALGTVEVGSHLEAQLPDALAVDAAAMVPWSDGEPYLLTYVGKDAKATIQRIRSDCLGWRAIGSASVGPARSVIPYRIGDASYALFYDG